MNVIDFVKRYAEDIDGQFTDYDHKTAVVIIPLKDGRYQAVLATTRQGNGNLEITVFSSKVCEIHPEIDYKSLVERNAELAYSRFVAYDGYLRVEAPCIADSVSEHQLKAMLQETATVADAYEMTLTGQDIH